MKHLISRKELCETLNMSKTHLIRKLKKFEVKPVEHAGYDIKKVYLVTDIERVFNIKIDDDGLAMKLEGDKSGELKSSSKGSAPNMMKDIEDILKDDENG